MHDGRESFERCMANATKSRSGRKRHQLSPRSELWEGFFLSFLFSQHLQEGAKKKIKKMTGANKTCVAGTIIFARFFL